MTDGTAAITKSAAAQQAQPWLANARVEAAFILAPAFISSLIVLAFHTQMEQSPDLPLWAWVCFVLLVDVAHVYATLFRTYFHEQASSKNRALLLGIPLACWVVGCLLYSIGGLLFWRVLAYLAVFHFIRQQYGFMVLYSRRDPPAFARWRWLDQACIYAAAIYPLLFWHTNLARHFSWFVEGDFAGGLPAAVATAGLALYAVLAVGYVIKEAVLVGNARFFNLPRNMILLGTALSWWVGIITFNSDFAFTITNVVSHGIPYMALVWLYHGGKDVGRNIVNAGAALAPRFSFQRLLGLCLSFAPLFVLVLVGFAYLEEGLWDGLVWREHGAVFGWFSALPAVSDPMLLALLVPLLALPQSTHYVLDGFIWRVKDRSSTWSA